MALRLFLGVGAFVILGVGCSSTPSVTATDGGAGVDGGATVRIGEGCTVNGECGGHSAADCLDEASWGFPGGYCTRACTSGFAGSCGPTARCAADPEGVARCLRVCNVDGDCREGYVCADNTFFTPVGGRVCLPGSRTGKIGSACTRTSDCTASPAAVCAKEGEGFAGGYCLEQCNPDLASPCPTGAECVPSDVSELGGVCAQRCAFADAGIVECRTGYSCTTRFAGVPARRHVCAPGTSGKTIGAECTTHSDCGPGDICIFSSAGPRGGYCSRPCSVTEVSPCGDGATCVITGSGLGYCAKSCAQATDCRAGYSCAMTFLRGASATSVCSPGKIDDVAIGAPCADTGDCNVAQVCLAMAGDFPGGYCTRECNASNEGACGGGNHCVALDADTVDGICMARCSTDGDCALRRGAGAGSYGCSARVIARPPLENDVKVCVGHTPAARVGSPCVGFADCALGTACIPEFRQDFEPWGRGYCSDVCDASATATCADGSLCIAIVPSSPAAGICADACGAGDECRTIDGYACVATSPRNAFACLPTSR